jgi:BirA family transcriptional regulator, biotin operon repressor / biotin---[acetyl-CoA-carboxylase] ligase
LSGLFQYLQLIRLKLGNKLYNNLPKTVFIGKSIIYLPTCHSTNDFANSLLVNPNVFEGSVVVCSSQTAGKGQRGNTWEAEPYKNLTCSLILKPKFLKVNQQFNLNIAISLAVYDLLTNYLGEKVKIKWPNDIYILNPSASKKICGILIQNTIKKDSIENAIVGIGLNINQEKFLDAKATSLFNITGREHDLEVILPQIMEFIEARYLQLKERPESLLQDYLNVLYWYKETHIFKANGQNFQGMITGLDDIGRLGIVAESKLNYFNLKEVEFVE